MDFLSLLQTDSSRAVADMGVMALESQPERFEELINFAFKYPYPVNMRAARVVELYCEKHPETILPFLEVIIEKLHNAQTDGVKRGFLKALWEVGDLSKVKNPGVLLTLCYNWLQSSSEALSVRVYALEVIYRISLIEPDIQLEMKAMIDLIQETEYPRSLQKRALQVRQRLANNNKSTRMFT
jgi:hypothetical protein